MHAGLYKIRPSDPPRVFRNEFMTIELILTIVTLRLVKKNLLRLVFTRWFSYAPQPILISLVNCTQNHADCQGYQKPVNLTTFGCKICKFYLVENFLVMWHGGISKFHELETFSNLTHVRLMINIETLKRLQFYSENLQLTAKAGDNALVGSNLPKRINPIFMWNS